MPPPRREPAKEPTTVRSLNWGSPAHWSAQARPCRYCGAPTHLRDSKGSPADKVCAEKALAEQQAESAEAYRVQGQL